MTDAVTQVVESSTIVQVVVGQALVDPGGGGGGISALTGDVTASGSGSVAATIAAKAVTLAKMADMATDSFLGRDTAGVGAPEVLSPAQARGILNVADGANAYVHPNHSGDVTSTGDGATVIADGAVTNSKMAVMDTATIKGRVTAGTGEPEDLTGAQVLGLLPAPGTTGEVLFNSDGAFGAATDVEIADGQLRLPFIADPATPAAGGLKLYGLDFGPGAPAFKLPNGKVVLVQSDLGDFSTNRFVAQVGLNAFTGEHSLNTTNVGTLTAATPAIVNLHRMQPRLDLLVTAATATAIAGWRPNGAASRFLRVGRDANAPGGFLVRQMWGPATGVSNATHRGFCGLADWSAAPTDVEPSARLNIIGMGWDAADANIQIMHNSGSGAATKIDLGADFPVPTADRNEVYEIQLYSPNELTQSVTYRVIRYNTTDKTIAAEATGTITTNLPAVSQLLGCVGAMSVGGTSSVVGVALMGILTARGY